MSKESNHEHRVQCVGVGHLTEAASSTRGDIWHSLYSGHHGIPDNPHANNVLEVSYNVSRKGYQNTVNRSLQPSGTPWALTVIQTVSTECFFKMSRKLLVRDVSIKLLYVCKTRRISRPGFTFQASLSYRPLLGNVTTISLHNKNEWRQK